MKTFWYVIRVIPGKEKTIKDNFNDEITTGNLKNIIRFVCPTEKEQITIRKKKITREKVIYTGYLYFEAEKKLTYDELKYIGTKPSIIGLLGDKKPVLLDKSDVNKILKDDTLKEYQDKKNKSIEKNTKVKIIDGSFKDFVGVVDSVVNNKVDIIINIFDRPTTINLDIDKLQKI